MALGNSRRNGQREGLNAWPGYVDALATLLIIIIFVLLVFVLAQGFLSVALSSRDRALDRLNRQVAELSELLSLERGSAEELRSGLGRAQEEARTAAADRDAARRDLSTLQEQAARAAAARDAMSLERNRLAARLVDAELASRGNAERITSLEARLSEALSNAAAAGTDTARTVQGLTETRRALASEQAARQGAERSLSETRAALDAVRHELETLREEASRLDRQVVADRATIETRLSEIARLNEQIRALTALRDQTEQQARAVLARADEEERRRRAAEAATATAETALAEATRASRGEAEARQAAETQAGEYGRLAESARAQAALLTQQLDTLRAELRRLNAALEAQEAQDREKSTQIAQLGQRLNAALAARVEELQRYRSDFFGRLRDVLGDRPEIRIAGDRFVFQSEVLFPIGSAELSEAGREQIANVTHLLLDIAQRIPEGTNWVLRVDGHADNSPIRPGSRYPTNWELSAARAIAVAQLMIQNGLPANRVAATAFGEFQPLDTADTPQARARNRRIELRLTDR
ncbi:peptidoglycan -binding protein [Roseomonas xinghualingensis]|uniref:peptidoglycan -binding protein n=1 Tax=Roseomonas xinghualingensis TaxID=2986475 RepID=UPI0021F1FD38|nr:peptidoglycan -binding protein [Roseomonas sp. SXEYE001]MCV4207949.1 peptidoglycan -binding protein [Roseomonas sp. SXEYE001]